MCQSVSKSGQYAADENGEIWEGGEQEAVERGKRISSSAELAKC